MEGWRVRKNGELFWANIVIERMLDADGRLVGYAKITRDVTERREAEDRLEQTRIDLFQSRKMEAIGQLTGGVAHDFNNLLMAVLGNLEMLQEMIPASDVRVGFALGNAIAGAQRGVALTQRMLAFARRQHLVPKPVDVPALVQGMAALLQGSIGEKHTIGMAFPLGLKLAMVDANQLELALMNLIVNARDAMPDGGCIDVRAQMQQLAARNKIDLPAGSYVCLSVSDTGIGMDGNALARATEPFYTTKGVGQGTGLGLPMVHGMAEQSGGRLVLRSLLGRGSTAELWLPVAPDPVRSDTVVPKPPNLRNDDQRLRLLVVDDDRLVLATMVMLLEIMGHDPIEANSGERALEILRETEVDLVITDYAMPGMNGAQLIEAVRSLWPTLPVIVASGYTDVGVADLPVERMTKPYGRQELAQTIRRAIRGRPAAR